METLGRGAGVGAGLVCAAGAVIVLAGLESGVTLGRDDLTAGLLAET